MILHTEGIVLRTLPYQDSHLISTLYTRDSGRRSFILRGYRASRSRSKHSIFQPLSILEIVYMHKENQHLHKIRESKLIQPLHQVHLQPVKLSLALGIVEIFYDCVKEEEGNPELYQFLKETLTYIDQEEKQLVHIFIHFLLHLTGLLGFLPLDRSDASQYTRFDPREGIFLPSENSTDGIAYLLRRFLHSGRPEAQQITFDQQEKRFIIKTLFDYYQLHIEGFQYPQTLKVFSEVFGN